MTTPTPLSYIELSRDAFVQNITALRNTLPPTTQITVALKANAYGHGLAETATILEPVVDAFQVDDIEELTTIRAVTQKPVYVFGYVASADLMALITLNGVPCVVDATQLQTMNHTASKAGVRMPVHVAIDAYLGREGVPAADAQAFCDVLKTCNAIEAQGIYAHFANIEDTSDFTHAQKQIDAFREAVDVFKGNGFSGLTTHISGTSGVLAYEQHQSIPNPMVRFGIGVYGYWPSEELRAQYQSAIALRPALRWVSHIAEIKTLPAGHPVGYGLTYITERATRVALVPQGYSDGYDRGLSNAGEILVRGVRCPILGRVMMNMCVIDVSHVDDAIVEDEAVLLGAQGSECISAEEIADNTHTINYEVIARISPLLPRRIV